MGFELNLEQQQKLVMTPELRLSLKILQMPQHELEELVQQEIESNPILELSDEEINKDDINEQKDILSEIIDETLLLKNDRENEIDWKEYLSYAGKTYETDSYNDENNDFSYDNLVVHNSTLKEYLTNQLKSQNLKKDIDILCEYLIESLDDNGYLTISLEEVSVITGLSFDIVEAALRIIQSFDPPGVAARNLKECLLIQLDNHENKDVRLKKIVTEYLQDLADNRINNISKYLKTSIEEAQVLCDIIKTLEPKPGRSFESAEYTRYIVPDVVVEKIGTEYVVFVNDSYSSRLSVSSYYKNILENENKDSSASQYISSKLSSAIWMIKSIENRRSTLYKVVKAMMKYQEEFLEYGTSHLKSMTLKTISEEISVHESTVSRAISGKFVQTPRGTFELKYFFKSGVGNSFGEVVSSESVKKEIQRIIHEENSVKPISDQEISDILTEMGIRISRRTVAKYREEIGIPSSSKRRRF